jgi:hypothetical protein
MILSLQSADGECGAYIDAALERQAIRRNAEGPTARAAIKAPRELQQFHQDEPCLKRSSRLRSACQR